MSKLTEKRRAYMKSKILASDLVSIVEDAKHRDFDFAVSLLTLKGSTPVGAMDDKTLQTEWREGEYASKRKDRYIRSTETYQSSPYIRELWEAKA